MSDTSKTAKIIKRWYHSPSHRLTVNVLLNNITFLWFLLFSMCHSFHIAINKCINWCFVHLYLLFYYNNKVFMLMVNYKPSALHGHENTEPYIFWGSRFWSLGVTWRQRNVTIKLIESTFLLVVNDDHESILHRYGDTRLQRFWRHRSRDHMWIPIGGPL